MVKPMQYIWLDGKLIPWDEANVHILTHTIHYGVGVFEGIRAYKCANGQSAIFRLNDHIKRLFYSASAVNMKIPFTESQLEKATIETCRANNLNEGYIRPLVFIGDGEMGPLSHNNPIRVAIITWEWGHYLGKEALEKGINVYISKWRRSKRVMPFPAKVCGNYVNAALAKKEAEEEGCAEALILDTRGKIAEGSAENIFIVRYGEIKTPTSDLPILKGITRGSVIHLARFIDAKVKEEEIGLRSLYEADEAFFTGTAAEITPIRKVGKRMIGKSCPGLITRNIQELYFRVVRGYSVANLIPYGEKIFGDEEISNWLTYF